ncbi:MAG: beta-glucuronidase, partial [Dictyoglomus sp.]
EVKDLSGLWDFKTEKDTEFIIMPVPSSYNDITQEERIRDYIGKVFYKRKFFVPKCWRERNIFLRIGSASHFSEVFVNGTKVIEHKGGFLPFENEISEIVKYGSENELVITVDNTLTWDTLPPGELKIIEDEMHPQGYKILNYYFDFFNYSGIHRPVLLYTTPKYFIEDLSIVTDVKEGIGIIKYEIESKGLEFQVLLREKDGRIVSENNQKYGVLELKDPRLWEPGNPYLYTLEVRLLEGKELLDVYRLEIGIRTIKVEGKYFLINNKPFYFKGFSKHEDSDLRGKGLDHVINVKDFNLLKWIGANSFRTAHYPYSEEILFLADKYGIAVIEEAPAVGMNLWNPRDKIFTKGRVAEKTLQHHLQVMRELISRDKNHPCIVMWSIANEAATYEEEAEEYFKRVIEETRKLDPTRPVTIVESSGPDETKVSKYVDVICVNRYYSWYTDSGDLSLIEYQLEKELRKWYELYHKPVILSEFGADSIVGFHQSPPVMFTEEYQWEMIKRYVGVLDKLDFVIGEHVWNFADFMTKQDIRRVVGNRKGVLTRQRQPKLVAWFLKERWNKVPDFWEK